MTDIDLIKKLADRFAAVIKTAHFSDEIVEARFKIAKGRCECALSNCGHEGQCSRKFELDDRGTSDHEGTWQAHHVIARSDGGTDDVTNCRILCVQCHKNTESYGKSQA